MEIKRTRQQQVVFAKEQLWFSIYPPFLCLSSAVSLVEFCIAGDFLQKSSQKSLVDFVGSNPLLKSSGRACGFIKNALCIQ